MRFIQMCLMIVPFDDHVFYVQCLKSVELI